MQLTKLDQEVAFSSKVQICEAERLHIMKFLICCSESVIYTGKQFCTSCGCSRYCHQLLWGLVCHNTFMLEHFEKMGCTIENVCKPHCTTPCLLWNRVQMLESSYYLMQVLYEAIIFSKSITIQSYLYFILIWCCFFCC